MKTNATFDGYKFFTGPCAGRGRADLFFSLEDKAEPGTKAPCKVGYMGARWNPFCRAIRLYIRAFDHGSHYQHGSFYKLGGILLCGPYVREPIVLGPSCFGKLSHGWNLKTGRPWITVLCAGPLFRFHASFPRSQRLWIAYTPTLEGAGELGATSSWAYNH